MSYLDVPRIHFAGKFIAKPSTVNNDPANYSRPEVEIDKIGLGWNPDGNHYWRLDSCTVRSAVGGGVDLVGATVQSIDQPRPSKLVDLDPFAQMVSQIWGLGIRVVAANGDSFEGSFHVVPFNDIWTRSPTGGMASAGAYYQSVLTNIKWSKNPSSVLLRKLRRRSPERLSIKFMVDSYQSDSTQPDFNFGRIVGTIGPAEPREPVNFVPGRLLRPVPGQPFNYAPARVDEATRRVFVDLGNSLRFTAPNGPLANMGNLQLAILPAAQPPQLLGPVGNVAYEQNAGVYELPLTTQQVALVSNTPLGVVSVNPATAPQVVLSENSIGGYIDATQYVFRMNPGRRAKLVVHAYAFGRPKANQTIRLTGQTAVGGPITGSPPPLGFPASVTTSSRGSVSLVLDAGDPGTPRGVIDGQVYKVSFAWDGAPADYRPDSKRILTVRVFSGFNVPASPTWADIEPIFDQYAKLYPFMRGIIDLSDPAAVQQALARISTVMSLPESDPGYMPVTRDLSENKRKAILKWIRNGAPQ